MERSKQKDQVGHGPDRGLVPYRGKGITGSETRFAGSLDKMGFVWTENLLGRTVETKDLLHFPASMISLWFFTAAPECLGTKRRHSACSVNRQGHWLICFEHSIGPVPLRHYYVRDIQRPGCTSSKDKAKPFLTKRQKPKSTASWKLLGVDGICGKRASVTEGSAHNSIARYCAMVNQRSEDNSGWTNGAIRGGEKPKEGHEAPVAPAPGERV